MVIKKSFVLIIKTRVVFRNTNIRTPRYRNDSENLFRFRKKIFYFENFSISEKYCEKKNTFRKWFFIFEMKKFQPRLIFSFRKIKINVENNFLISRLKYSNRDWFFHFEIKIFKPRLIFSFRDEKSRIEIEIFISSWKKWNRDWFFDFEMKIIKSRLIF